MRFGNAVVTAFGAFGAVAASRIVWRGRDRAMSVDVRPSSWRQAAMAAVRTFAAHSTAGLVAGVVVVGLFGRLVMRVLGATSGDGAQGRTTDAGERVGEITFDGSLGFIIFAGIIVPLIVTTLFAVIRELLPNRAVTAGLIFGLVLLATSGTDDPLATDNVDFRILSPTWLAALLIVATGLLFGACAAVLSNRFETTLQTGGGRRWQRTLMYLPLVLACISPLVFVVVVAVAVRAVSRGRIRGWLDRRPSLAVARLAQGAAIVMSIIVVGRAVIDIT